MRTYSAKRFSLSESYAVSLCNIGFQPPYIPAEAAGSCEAAVAENIFKFCWNGVFFYITVRNTMTLIDLVLLDMTAPVYLFGTTVR